MSARRGERLREERPAPHGAEETLARRHRRFGWVALLSWMTAGLVLETLHGYKIGAYLQDPVRRELLTLAHFHGALLAVVNLVYVRWAESPALTGGARRLASLALLTGSLLLPLGFLIGGAFPFEGDPGLGIALSPLGAIALLTAAALQVRAAFRDAG